MVQEATECAASKSTLPIPVIPSLPQNIANVQKTWPMCRKHSQCAENMADMQKNGRCAENMVNVQKTWPMSRKYSQCAENK